MHGLEQPERRPTRDPEKQAGLHDPRRVCAETGGTSSERRGVSADPAVTWSSLVAAPTWAGAPSTQSVPTSIPIAFLEDTVRFPGRLRMQMLDGKWQNAHWV